MRKHFSQVTLFLCLALLLAGCGKQDDTGTASPDIPAPATEQATDSSQDASPDRDTEQKPDAEQEPDTAQETDPESASGLACPSVNGALSVKGTQLVDQNGSPVQLRGISTHGLAWYPQYVNEPLFQELHENWKVNVMRLAMYTAEYGGYCTGGDQNQLKALIRDGVSYATNQDMYVIIDWHILSDNNPTQYQTEAISFWDEISKTYASSNNVIYEICNEPNGGTDWSQVKAYADTIIPVIRANDADAVILVGTPNWCQQVDAAAADPLSGYDNIMYTLHFYAATHKEDLRNTMVSAVNSGLPIFVSEYGICDASGNGAIDTVQADAWVDIMNQYGISYVAWSLSNKEETSAIISSSVTKTSGFTTDDLSDAGKWLYEMLTESSK